MKIGLLTLIGRNHNFNIGAVLQAYALQNLIMREGMDCEIIDYTPTRKFIVHLFWSLKNKGVEYVVPKAVFLVVKEIKNKMHKEIENYRIRNIEDFKHQYLHFTPRNFKDINALKNTDYEVYLVGSDLVWSPRYNDSETLSAYLLSFVRDAAKISYAASIGEPIPNWACSIFRTYLRGFNFVSVREETSAKYLKDCTGINAKIVLDPTALLKQREWERLSRAPEKEPEGEYVLVYDIFRSKEILSEINPIARKKGWNIVTYSPSKDNLYFYSYGPQEFLWLCKNAEYVISSSFHGTVFAVLFGKPFYAIDPRPEAPPSRIFDFLKRLHLEDRFVKNTRNLKTLNFDSPDWTLVNSMLENDGIHSLKFLRKALKSVKK